MRTPLGLSGAVIVIALSASRADADPIAVGDIVTLHTTQSDGTEIAQLGDGGPFRMDLAGMVADIISFCLEADESFEAGENLQVGGLTDQALAGGVNTDSGDPISGTTAFLYTQFRAGVSAYSNGLILQEAVWYLENEISSASAAAAAMIALAQTDMLAAGWGSNHLGNVRVANLYRGADFSVHAQDMLVLVPEPGTLLLLGIGVAVLGRFRRRP